MGSSLWCGGGDNSGSDQETSQPLPVPHPLMEKYPANAQDYIGKVLVDKAYLVIIKGEPIDACGSFNEAITILTVELDESEVTHQQLGVYYNQGDPTPIGWISVVSLDVVDDLGLLYLP